MAGGQSMAMAHPSAGGQSIAHPSAGGQSIAHPSAAAAATVLRASHMHGSGFVPLTPRSASKRRHLSRRTPTAAGDPTARNITPRTAGLDGVASWQTTTPWDTSSESAFGPRNFAPPNRPSVSYRPSSADEVYRTTSRDCYIPPARQSQHAQQQPATARAAGGTSAAYEAWLQRARASRPRDFPPPAAVRQPKTPSPVPPPPAWWYGSPDAPKQVNEGRDPIADRQFSRSLRPWPDRAGRILVDESFRL